MRGMPGNIFAKSDFTVSIRFSVSLRPSQYGEPTLPSDTGPQPPSSRRMQLTDCSTPTVATAGCTGARGQLTTLPQQVQQARPR